MMPFILFMVWMGFTAWCSFCMSTSFFPSDMPFARLGFWLVLWCIFVAVAFPVMMHFYPNKPRGTFRLNRVTLHYYGDSAQYAEVLSMEISARDYVVKQGINVFYAILEDTDNGNPRKWGTEYNCRPVYITNLQDHEVHSQTDLLKVTIDKDGMPTVEYIGPEKLVRADCNWELIPGEKK